MDTAKPDPDEERNLDGAGWHLGENAFLIQRRGSEEIKIERFTMPKMQRNGGPDVENEIQSGGWSKVGPDFLLRSRQDVKSRLKSLRHEILCAEPCAELPPPYRTATGRARTPTSDR